jgi:hypothetical protein
LAISQEVALRTATKPQPTTSDLEVNPSEFGQALTEFESMVNAFNAGRREHIGARAELDAVVKDIGEVVRVLDGLNRYRFGADPNLMAVWNAAREVFGRDTPWWESRRPDAIVAVMLER